MEIVTQELVLVLILLAGADDTERATALQAELVRLGGAAVEVHVGDDASARLSGFDVSVADLMATPRIGRQLTNFQNNLIIIHFDDRSQPGGSADSPVDHVVDATIWRAGNSDRVTSIGGQGEDPIPGLLQSLQPLLGSAFAGSGPSQPGLARIGVADLVAAQRWTDVLLRLTEVDGALSPKQAYYQVLAYSRLGNRTAALEALSAMRAEHGHHWMVAAAEAEIPAQAPEGDDDDLLLPNDEISP